MNHIFFVMGMQNYFFAVKRRRKQLLGDLNTLRTGEADLRF